MTRQCRSLELWLPCAVCPCLCAFSCFLALWGSPPPVSYARVPVPAQCWDRCLQESEAWRSCTKACQGEGAASPAVGQGALSFIPTLQCYSWPCLAAYFIKGVWDGTGHRSLQDVVGSVSIPFIFKMLIKLTWVIDTFLCVEFKRYRSVP